MKYDKRRLKSGLDTLNPTYLSRLTKDELIGLIFKLKEENKLFRQRLKQIQSLSYDVRGGIGKLKSEGEGE